MSYAFLALQAKEQKGPYKFIKCMRGIVRALRNVPVYRWVPVGAQRNLRPLPHVTDVRKLIIAAYAAQKDRTIRAPLVSPDGEQRGGWGGPPPPSLLVASGGPARVEDGLCRRVR